MRPNSHLYANLWVPWAESHPVPETPPASWANQCGKQVYESVTDTQGWVVRPKVTGPTAAAVAAASGWLNPDWESAPIGAFHFWLKPGTPGHVAQDLNGGGEVCSMATGYPLIWELHPELGVQSVPGYKGPWRYAGWSTNYGGGIPRAVAAPVVVTPPPPAPVPVPVPAPVVVADPAPLPPVIVAPPAEVPPVVAPPAPAPVIVGQVPGEVSPAAGKPAAAQSGFAAFIQALIAVIFGSKK